MPVTHGVVGRHRSCRCPAPCKLLPERGQIVAGGKLCRQNFFGPGACLSGKECGFVCLKEITHGKSCCLCFIGQHCLWNVLLRPSLPSAIYLSCFLISIYGRSFGPTCPYGSRYMTLPFAWWVARTSTSAICTCAGAEAA